MQSIRLLFQILSKTEIKISTIECKKMFKWNLEIYFHKNTVYVNLHFKQKKEGKNNNNGLFFYDYRIRDYGHKI